MKDKLLIIGAGGHGKVAADIALKMCKWKDIAFVDDNESVNTFIGLPIIGKIEDVFRFKNEADFFVAIGNNYVRERVQEGLIREGVSIVSLIHPKSVIGIGVEIGAGSIIMAGVVINSSCKIGNGCIINTNSSIDHDNMIKDYVHISPGVNIAGTVDVGKNSWIGIGSVVSNNINICDNCNIGAGAVVVKDIVEPGTYIGIPVRKIN